MSEANVRREFDDWAERGRGESMARGHRDVTDQALDRVAFGPGDRVLDVGCGIGWAVQLMLERGAGRGVGIDLSPEMVARAKRDDRASFVAGTATSMPFADGAFTAVLSVESLYYYADLDRAIGEIRRVCAPGARFSCVLDLYADNPGTHQWVEALDVDVHNLSAAEYRARFLAAGFSEASSLQVVDRRPVETPEEFEPSRWFPEYGSYRTYRELGALVVEAVA